MPVQGFSIGKDVSLSFNDPNGTYTTIGLTSFSAKPGFTDIKSKRLDGKTYFAEIPDGWNGTFRLDRLDSSLDTFFANLEAAYYAGTNIQSGTIQEVIQEPDGSISTWQYQGVVMKLDDPGMFEGDKRVEQSVSFNAITKVKVG